VRRLEVLVVLELATGLSALAGGVLLMSAPDGHLLDADRAALAGSPFGDWRIPGLLLAIVVGIGFLAAAAVQWAAPRIGAVLSALAGTGLILFEAVEWTWLGFQPLEAALAAVGVVIVILAARQLRSR
jgi:hypothetical protein